MDGCHVVPEGAYVMVQPLTLEQGTSSGLTYKNEDVLKTADIVLQIHEVENNRCGKVADDAPEVSRRKDSTQINSSEEVSSEKAAIKENRCDTNPQMRSNVTTIGFNEGIAPIFRIKMHKSHLGPKWQLSVPSWAARFFPRGNALIRVICKGSTYEMRFRGNTVKLTFHPVDWKFFALVNDLRRGDIVTFDVWNCGNPDRIILGVHTPHDDEKDSSSCSDSEASMEI